MTETEVCLDLFIEWLNHTYGRAFHLDGAPDSDALAKEPEATLRLAVRPLLTDITDRGWESARESLEERLGEAVPATTALWVPLGAELPRDEPAASELVDQVSQAAIRLGPIERSYVPFQIKLVLRKNVDTGGVVSVSGGLNPHWARFTERVTGSYDLDATQLHRIPESEEHLERLLDSVVEASKEIKAGQAVAIETIDPWTIQRLPGKRGVSIIGAPPAAASDSGLAVRRNLKRTLADAAPALRAADGDLRALVILVPYARAEHDGVTTALRGYDPGLYAGIDFVCLLADGVVRPIIQAPVKANAAT